MLKRVVESSIAATLLVLFSPVLAAVALAVRVTMGAPVIFRQERAGIGGRAFEICKFRTMRSGQGSDEQRLTRTGKLLRSTSLDELPELINVLRGEMSFVGPRPLPTKYLERYSGEQVRRHEVKPGITGLAQVNGRNLLDWEERFELDVEYVDTASPVLDMRIAVKTIRKVVQRDGISGDGVPTMTEFTGSHTTVLT